MSGWRDSNSRPRRPERRALTGLRYTPKPHILTIYAPKPNAKVQTFFHPPIALSPILRTDTSSHRPAPIVNAAQRSIATHKRQASSQLAPTFTHLHTRIASTYPPPHPIPTFPSLQTDGPKVTNMPTKGVAIRTDTLTFQKRRHGICQ